MAVYGVTFKRKVEKKGGAVCYNCTMCNKCGRYDKMRQSWTRERKCLSCGAKAVADERECLQCGAKLPPPFPKS